MLPIIIVSDNQEYQKNFLANFLENENIPKINIQNIISEKAFSITDVRNIKKTIFLKTFNSNKKAVIIYNFNLASKEAQNSMLKILEEPPADTQIILLSENENLLPTIISRCKIIKLHQNQLIDKEILPQFKILLQKNRGEKFYFAQEISKDKKTLLDWINNLSRILTAEIRNKEDKEKLKEYYSLLKQLNTSYYQIYNSNISSRFVIENLFLETEGVIL